MKKTTKPVKKKAVKKEEVVLSTFKGFDKDLKCRDYQFEIGKTYKEPDAIACNRGFHACKFPFDVFKYYPPVQSRYCTVKQSGIISEHADDTKVASSVITVCEEIGLTQLINEGVKYLIEQSENKESNTGYQSAATNTGNQSAATNTGYQSAATNTGNYSAATNTGNQSAATNTGNQSAATNTGYQSAATNTGDYSAATNTGYKSAATNTGYKSAATNTGNQSAATNTGYQSAATNTGDYSAAAVGGKNSIAMSMGYKGCAAACIGSWIVLAEWEESGSEIINVKSARIDGQILKPDTFYVLINGEFVEQKN